MADVTGLVASIDSVVTNIMRNPTGIFVAALEPGVYPIRDFALQNGLLQPIVDRKNNKITWHQGATGMTSLYLNAQINANNTTTFNVGATVAGGLKPNDLIAFNTEIVRVVSVDSAAGTCEVVRGFGGTTPLATIAVTVLGKIISTTPTEEEAAGESALAYGAADTNYLHYMEEVVKLTDKTQGQLDQMDTPEMSVSYQIRDKFKVLARKLAYALWLSATDGTGSSTYQTMNSLRSFVPSDSTNTTAINGALKFAHIDDAVEASMNVGVILDTLFISPAWKNDMGGWANERLKTVLNADPAAVGGTLDRFRSSPGPVLEVLPDSSLMPGDCFICRRSDLHAGPVAVLDQVIPSPDLPQQTGIRVERLARTGAQNTVQILSYWSCQLTNKDGAQLLTGISSVDSDGV